MNNIKYRYALNEHQLVVSIQEITQENRHAHTYHCLECGAEMIPRIGTKNVKHFAHKNETSNCSNETYLHKLAKRLIKDAFESNKTFVIKYQRYSKCSKYNNCPIYDEERCKDRNRDKDDGRFNLKEFYDTCEEEQEFGGYRADLLLTHSENRDREPIFIEIHVKHKLTEEKKNSGNKIIELTIKSETDIENFISQGIEECQYPEEKKEGYAQFYGFKTFSQSTIKGWKCNLGKFFLYPSGKTFLEYIDCYKAFVKNSDQNCEITFLPNDFHNDNGYIKYGCILYQKKYISNKLCPLCKYYSEQYPPICRLYKKFDTPRIPQACDANKCKYYRENHEKLRRIKLSIKEINEHSGEIDGINYIILP